MNISIFLCRSQGIWNRGFICGLAASRGVSKDFLLEVSADSKMFFPWNQRIVLRLFLDSGFPGGSGVKNPPASAGDLGLIPESGRSPGGVNGNPLQYSCWDNPVDRGAWQVIVHWVPKCRTRLSMHACRCRLTIYVFSFQFLVISDCIHVLSSSMGWWIIFKSQPNLTVPGTQGMSSVSLLRTELEATALGILEMVVAEIIDSEVSFPQRKWKSGGHNRSPLNLKTFTFLA